MPPTSSPLNKKPIYSSFSLSQIPLFLILLCSSFLDPFSTLRGATEPPSQELALEESSEAPIFQDHAVQDASHEQGGSLDEAAEEDVPNSVPSLVPSLLPWDLVKESDSLPSFGVSQKMITWGELVLFLNQTCSLRDPRDPEHDLHHVYTSDIEPFIIRSLEGSSWFSRGHFSYAITPQHPEYAAQPAICTLAMARHYCNYREVLYWLMKQGSGEKNVVTEAEDPIARCLKHEGLWPLPTSDNPDDALAVQGAQKQRIEQIVTLSPEIGSYWFYQDLREDLEWVNPQALFHLFHKEECFQWIRSSATAWDRLKGDDFCEWIDALNPQQEDSSRSASLLQHGVEPAFVDPQEGEHPTAAFRLVVNTPLLQEGTDPSQRISPLSMEQPDPTTANTVTVGPTLWGQTEPMSKDGGISCSEIFEEALWLFAAPVEVRCVALGIALGLGYVALGVGAGMVLEFQAASLVALLLVIIAEFVSDT